MRVSRISALLITAMMIPAISGCTTQGSPAPDAVHQIENDGSAVYDDDPIAVEPQLDEDGLDGGSDESNMQGRSFRRNRIKGVRIEKSNCSNFSEGRCWLWHLAEVVRWYVCMEIMNRSDLLRGNGCSSE